MWTGHDLRVFRTIASWNNINTIHRLWKFWEKKCDRYQLINNIIVYNVFFLRIIVTQVHIYKFITFSILFYRRDRKPENKKIDAIY